MEDNNNTMNSRRVGLMIGVAVISVSLLILAWWLMSPGWRPVLPAGVDPDVRQEATALLSQWQVPFREDAATGEVLVQSDDLAAVRRQLGDAGVPAKIPVGLELFSDAGLGMSEFAQRINYQRGLEGEISQTLRAFLDVRSARVHLTMPRESIFRDRREQAKASVVIEMRPEQDLSAEKVRGVQSLVAAAVENLDAGAVVVLDEKGMIHSTSMDQGTMVASAPERDVVLMYENKARELLLGVVPDGEFRVAVSVRMNFDRVKSVQETLLPADKSGGFLAKRRQTNVIDPDADKKNSGAEQRSMDEEYLYSKETSEIEYATGNVEQINVGIVVPSDLSEDRLSDISSVITTGLGLDPGRGDRVEIITVAPSQALVASSNQFAAADVAAAPQGNVAGIETLSVLAGGQLATLSLGVVAGMLIAGLLSFGFSQSRSRKTRGAARGDKLQLLAEAKGWLEKNEPASASQPGPGNV